MAYKIPSDRSIKYCDRRSRNGFVRWFHSISPKFQLVVVALAATVARKFLLSFKNPLAGGAVPAAGKLPDEHWLTISEDPFFVRTMTEHLVAANGRKAKTARFEAARRMNSKTITIQEKLDMVDFGTIDGHVAEKADFRDLESVRVTRCATSQSAVTAYFCGADVAGNMDAVLGDRRKAPNWGVRSFAEFVSCRHGQGERNGGRHRRSVYRINIGCRDVLAGYSHAFSIIAQPDGTFFWLQSFISHYSLTKWMSQPDRGHLSLTELLAKLERVDRLMNITGWTSEANSDYLELFGVDKEGEALKKRTRIDWKPTHRLEGFSWDEACEYPLPTSPKEQEGLGSDGESPAKVNDLGDECVTEYWGNMLKELINLQGIPDRAEDDEMSLSTLNLQLV